MDAPTPLRRRLARGAPPPSPGGRLLPRLALVEGGASATAGGSPLTAADDQLLTARTGTPRSPRGAPPSPSPPLLSLDTLLTSPLAAFVALAALRVPLASYYALITDCDETFNYWEPTHYMLYGSGLQTWEYDPKYAFRSYAYTGVHAGVGWLVGAGWGADKVAVFQRTRCVLAAACAAGEALLVVGAAAAFGRRVGALTLGGLAASAGMAAAAPSFLPSTWTMVWLSAAWGVWLRGEGAGARGGGRRGGRGTAALAAASAVGLLLGWPFAVVALAPWGLHLLASRPTLALLGGGAGAGAGVLAASALADRAMYGRWLCAAAHIIAYNALGVGGGGQGSDLYGVEPPSWYARNLALSFNLLAPLAALSPLALAAAAARSRLGARGLLLAPPPTAASGGAACAAGGGMPHRALPAALALCAQLWLW